MNRFKIANFNGGLNQSGDDGVISVNESKDAQNVNIDNGDLRTIKGYSKYIATAVGSPTAITRLMKFYKTNTSTGAVTSYLLAATSGAVYKWNTGTSAWDTLASGLTSGNWDYINYQISATDVVIMGNGVDVMKKWDGATFESLGGTPPVAKSLSIHSERLWATGVNAYPNTVYYSDDLNPENWTSGEDAAGEIYLPTWDGGKCIGVSTIFSDLVIFKTNNIYRVLGTYPSVYEVKEVYSSVGAIAERSIVSSNDKAFFMSKDGLYYYNGVSAYPLLNDKLKDVVINSSYVENAVSIVYKNKLYCAFPEGTATSNSSVIVYDILKNTVMLWRGIAVTDFIEYQDKLLFTNATGYIYNLDNTTLTFDGTAISAYWETPWQDLNGYNLTKSADTLYFYASGTAGGQVKIDVTFDTKTKTKYATLTAAGKVHALPCNMEGRRFKLKFSNVSGSDFILKEPELTYEVDED